jgi:drug/metabolite transporter (DMT)-like permease
VRPSWLFPAGAALALVGVVLLVVETARALAGNALGSLATDLLWVGVGLVAVGAVLLVLSVTLVKGPDLDSGQPADG